MTRPSLDEIRSRLQLALPTAQFEVLDESHLHAGHAGSSGGAGHFRIRVQDPAFAGLSSINRHRLVYDALRDWMPDRIHALAIEARP